MSRERVSELYSHSSSYQLNNAVSLDDYRTSLLEVQLKRTWMEVQKTEVRSLYINVW